MKLRSEEALELITGQFPRIAVHLAKGIASRIPRLFESPKISRKAVNIAVVPISPEDHGCILLPAMIQRFLSLPPAYSENTFLLFEFFS